MRVPSPTRGTGVTRSGDARSGGWSAMTPTGTTPAIRAPVDSLGANSPRFATVRAAPQARVRAVRPQPLRADARMCQVLEEELHQLGVPVSKARPRMGASRLAASGAVPARRAPGPETGAVRCPGGPFVATGSAPPPDLVIPGRSDVSSRESGAAHHCQEFGCDLRVCRQQS